MWTTALERSWRSSASSLARPSKSLRTAFRESCSRATSLTTAAPPSSAEMLRTGLERCESSKRSTRLRRAPNSSVASTSKRCKREAVDAEVSSESAMAACCTLKSLRSLRSSTSCELFSTTCTCRDAKSACRSAPPWSSSRRSSCRAVSPSAERGGTTAPSAWRATAISSLSSETRCSRCPRSSSTRWCKAQTLCMQAWKRRSRLLSPSSAPPSVA
mmetsp:Transcript_112300/g.250652  ORF Transcript_112300/g.250652 Transcript_112300/m.250652 type:complete len:216 (-) Transcript_112300:689-1336(-)